MAKYILDRERNNARIRRKRYTGERQSGRKLSAFTRGKFLAWDGEGIQRDGKQVYGLLANSNGQSIIDVLGLSTSVCLEFLTGDFPDYTIHVCFGASYDINQILRDVDQRTLRRLHKGERVKFREYDLQYRPRKSLSIRRYRKQVRVTKTGEEKVYRVFDIDKGSYIIEKSMVLYDCFGFFQKKFVSVMKEWFRGTEFEDKYKLVISDIEEGKEKRGSFTQEEVETFVLPYCLNECYALRDIMHILHGYLQEAELVLSRWDGAGAIGAALLKKHNIKSFIRRGPKLKYAAEPEWVTLASEYAYFGGWIECFKFGNIQRKVSHYDERSAYPDKERKLQSLMHGEWRRVQCNWLQSEDVEVFLRNLPSYWIAHIEWNCPERYKYIPGPFSWRSKQGNVSRPLKGRGWQWSPEVLACMDVCKDVEVKIGWVYYFAPDEEVYPFKFVEDIYASRAKHKEEGKGVEKTEKLEVNAIYGKLAQSLGYNKETGMKPPYNCLVYAGLITSMTRADILRAVSQAPEAIITIATDGIYSLQELDLDIGKGLGQWEFTEHESMTVVQSGVYWYDTKGEESHYYRGFNEGSISREKVIDAYRRGILNVGVRTTRFVTLGSAIGLNDFSQWRTWKTISRTLDLWMQKSSKRIWLGEIVDGDSDILVSQTKILDPSLASGDPADLDSHKYSFDWDDPPIEGQSAREFAEEMFHQELSTDE